LLTAKSYSSTTGRESRLKLFLRDLGGNGASQGLWYGRSQNHQKVQANGERKPSRIKDLRDCDDFSEDFAFEPLIPLGTARKGEGLDLQEPNLARIGDIPRLATTGIPHLPKAKNGAARYLDSSQLSKIKSLKTNNLQRRRPWPARRDFSKSRPTALRQGVRGIPPLRGISRKTD